ARVVRGWGGMPVMTQGKVIALFSGGIDSAVAAWLMMKRGCGVIPLHFYQNEVEAQKVQGLVEVLQEYSAGFLLRPVIVDHGEVMGGLVERLRGLGHERWTCLLCKWAMLRKAAAVADEFGALALVTGDSLGQVASQTIQNLAAVSEGLPKLVFRPLIGWDKTEVMDLAQQIGTYQVSTSAAEGCEFLPRHPLTRATPEGFRQVLQDLQATDRLG
ncbi:MAG: tRNA sulfurtransferase, partial [Chloroflexi bacterium]|nr:tRNA sulfurtransferase [Chloroflexota bacterium]